MVDINYIIQELGVAALAAGDVIAATTKIDASRLQGYRISKMEYGLHFEGGDDADAVWFGLATGLTAAEVEECLEADPQSPQDVPAAEQVKRFVFPLKLIGAGSEPVNATKTLNWSIKEGQDLTIWAYNPTSAAISAGCVVQFVAKIYGKWLND